MAGNKKPEESIEARIKRIRRLLKRAERHKEEHENMQAEMAGEFGDNSYRSGQLVGINPTSVRNSLKMKNLKPDTMVQWLENALKSLESQLESE